MEGSSAGVASGSQKCRFSNRKTHIRECHPKKFHPCAGKTIGAERVLIVVVGFACMACIIFMNLFIFFRFVFTKCFKTYTLRKSMAIL